MESKFTYEKEDQEYMDKGENADEKAFRKSIIDAAILLNGSNDNAQPGVAVSYIPEDNYNYIIAIDSMLPKQVEIYEQALNWNALGKGKGGLTGAAVRYRLRRLFAPNRESKVITAPDATHTPIIKEYIAYLNANRQTFSVWFSNAWNVVGLATSCFIRESHHWDANNVRPIKALLGSLSQENEIPESEYRKLFYLSIHPLPLETFSLCFHKSLDPLDSDISATVKTRLNVAPSGYADLCACAIAADSFLHEDFASKCLLYKDIVNLVGCAQQLKLDPISFHPFASQMGMKRKELSKANLTEAMIVLGAYAKSCIGGTLANSPALIKFLDLHARKVNKLVRGFAEYNDRKSDDLIRILTGEASRDLEIVSEEIKPLAKLAQKLKDMSDDKVGPIAKAAVKVEERISEVVMRIGGDIPKPPEGIPSFVGEQFQLSTDLINRFNVDRTSLDRVAALVKVVQPKKM